jgi:translation initiation factor 2 gamma subunit (eIF-2gamma)
MKLSHIIVLQNKADLMREDGGSQHYQLILKFIRGTVADGFPITPISDSPHSSSRTSAPSTNISSRTSRRRSATSRQSHT